MRMPDAPPPHLKTDTGQLCYRCLRLSLRRHAPPTRTVRADEPPGLGGGGDRLQGRGETAVQHLYRRRWCRCGPGSGCGSGGAPGGGRRRAASIPVPAAAP